MICGNCGKEIEQGTKFCIFCGSMVELNNTDSDTGYSKTDHTEYSGNALADSVYNLEDAPEKKKKKKKRPLWLSFVCGFFTWIFAIVMFCLCIALLFSIIFFGNSSDAVTVFSSKNNDNMGYSSLPVGGLVNSIDDSKSYDSDITLSEYVYDKLPASEKDNTTEEDIAEMLDDPSIKSFVDDVLDGYLKVLTGEEKEVKVSNEQILDLIEDNEELVESALGRELTSSDYSKIEEKLIESGFEENTAISIDNDNPVDEVPYLKTVIQTLSNPTAIYAGLGVAIVILAVLILLLNLHKPYIVLLKTGLCAILSSGIGYAFNWAFNTAFNQMDENARYNVEFAFGIIGNPQNRIAPVSAVFLGVGLAMIVVYIVIGIIRKVIANR